MVNVIIDFFIVFRLFHSLKSIVSDSTVCTVRKRVFSQTGRNDNDIVQDLEIHTVPRRMLGDGRAH